MKQILVADDDPGIRVLLNEALTAKGYKVVLASDGLEACSLAEKDAFDLVLLDVMLPRQDGFATLLRLRGMPDYAATPILILSGEPNLANTVVALGASGFLAKPFKISDILARVREALAA